MEKLLNSVLKHPFFILSIFCLTISACSSDDEGGLTDPMLTGNSEEYSLFSKSDPGITGMVTFAERDDGITVITIELSGTSAGGDHPTHIHANTAAEGGTILLDLTNVDGANGMSVSEVSTLNDGSSVSYNDLINIDGYINVHLSSGDLGTLIAQGDIGVNELTGTSTEYTINSKSNPNISGTATFSERSNGFTLITVQLEGTDAAGDHPTHIHANTAAEGGGISVDLANVNGATGVGATSVNGLNDGTAITYAELIEFNGYINVHLSSDNLGTLVGQGDIGQNALTENFVEYSLNSVSNPNISGTATFSERNNGFTLITVQLEGTDAAGDHPTHIHANTAAEGGGISVDLANVDGATGVGATSVNGLNDGTAITYAELIEFNGYINVHLSSDNLGTLVGQGDIGQNALTENSVEYPLNSVSNPNISGTATFSERNNSFTLITVQLEGTDAAGDHPTHIHNNDAASGGGIAVDLSNVNGATGISTSSISMLNDGTAVTYEELVIFNGYINVHLSDQDLGTLIAQGNIGSNAD